MNQFGSTKPALVVLALLLFAAAACSSDDGGSKAGAAEAAAEAGADREYALAQRFELSIIVASTKFNETRRIPRKYSCTEEDVSPPITWGDAPDGTVSLALLVESNQHPGPLWVHWLLWGIPPDARELPEDIARAGDAPAVGPSAAQGTNNEKVVGWSGPCPPTLVLNYIPGHGGGPRRAASQYFFRLYALDIDLELEPGATEDDFLRAIDGHILAGGELVGEHVSNKHDFSQY